jgi:methionine-rich copper-binding protein CopC
MCHFVMPAAVAAAAALAVPLALAPPVFHQPQTDGSDLWRGRGDQQTLSATLPNLPPGQRTVTRHVTSVDTHKTQGRFVFTVMS